MPSPINSWGPSFWMFFHLISALYPDNPTAEDMEMSHQLIKMIYYVLPCKLCSDHYYDNLKVNPFKKDDARSKKDFMLWFINFHNIVNKLLGKKLISFGDAIIKINALKAYKYTDLFMKVLSKINMH